MLNFEDGINVIKSLLSKMCLLQRCHNNGPLFKSFKRNCMTVFKQNYFEENRNLWYTKRQTNLSDNSLLPLIILCSDLTLVFWRKNELYKIRAISFLDSRCSETVAPKNITCWSHSWLARTKAIQTEETGSTRLDWIIHKNPGWP